MLETFHRIDNETDREQPNYSPAAFLDLVRAVFSSMR
jgi:hypothetical protein